LSNRAIDQSQVWYFNSKTPSNQNVQLVAHHYFFPDAAAAQRAFQQAQSSLSACATQPELDSQGQPLTNAVHRTAAITNGIAFVHTRRSPTGAPYTAVIPMIPYTHEYLVQRGTIIAMIQINASAAINDQPSNDQGVLQLMAEHLCTSNQHC
jgi:hypothetical protein